MKPTFGIFLILAAFGLSSCCTKVECDHTYYPEAKILFEDAPDSLLFMVTVESIDKNSGQKINIHDYEATRAFTFTPGKYLSQAEISGFYYVITSLYNSSDTLYSLDYEKKAEKVECNSCFLGDGSATVIRYSNFSYKHKGLTYTTEQNLSLKK